MDEVKECPICGASRPGPATCRKCGADFFSDEVRAMMAERAAAQRAIAAAQAAPPPPPYPPPPYPPPPPPPPPGPAALTSFYCQCGTPLSVAVGTPTVVCHRCGLTMGVPIAAAAPPPAPPAYYPPPPPPPVETGRRPVTIVLRLICGVVLIFGCREFVEGEGQAMYASGDRTIYWIAVFGIPFGIALVLGGLYEAISNKRIGLLGRE